MTPHRGVATAQSLCLQAKFGAFIAGHWALSLQIAASNGVLVGADRDLP